MLNPITTYEQLKEGTFDGDILRSVDDCVTIMKDLNLKIEEAENGLKQLKSLTDLIGSKVIPGLMFLAHTKSLEMDDGSKVSYKEVVYCSLPKEDQVAREKALTWLAQNGAGHIIKDQITVESPTEAVIAELTGKFRIERTKDVHAASLKAYMSELLGIKEDSVARMSPEEVPQELHLYIENKTTIKEKKNKGN